jgi:uncharacterized protein
MPAPFRHAAVIIALLLSAAGLRAQTPAPVSAPASTKTFMWTVERDGRVGWLVGSLHLLTADHYPLPASMEAAFARADALVEEMDMNEAADPATAALILSKGMNPPGTTLSSQVSGETYSALTAWLTRRGLTALPFEAMRPWMVSMTLQVMALQSLGFDPALGLDKYFRDAATKTGKHFIALETAAEQIEYLSSFSLRTQDLMLRESLESLDTELAEVKTIAAAWRTGNAETLERIAVSSMKDAPEVYQSLLVDRNRRWMPAIESCLSTRRCFIVVGAAHLVGADGLVTLLRQRGYRVEQQ